jgi:hypothetical protein
MGSGRALTARFAPLPDGSTMAVFSDISESERISEALIERSASLAMAETARGALVRLLDRAPAATLGGFEEKLNELGRSGRLPEDANGLASGIAETSAALHASLVEARSILARPLDPRDDRTQNCDVGEILRFVRAIVAPRAENAGVDLALDDSRAPHAGGCSTGRLRQIAFHLAIDAIARAQPGFRVTLGAEGDPDGFSVYVECGPEHQAGEGAADGTDGTRTEVMQLVQRLVQTEKGRMQIEEDVKRAWSRVICSFPAPGSRQRHVDAVASGELVPAAGLSDNVHELKTRAS